MNGWTFENGHMNECSVYHVHSSFFFRAIGKLFIHSSYIQLPCDHTPPLWRRYLFYFYFVLFPSHNFILPHYCCMHHTTHESKQENSTPFVEPCCCCCCWPHVAGVEASRGRGWRYLLFGLCPKAYVIGSWGLKGGHHLLPSPTAQQQQQHDESNSLKKNWER